MKCPAGSTPTRPGPPVPRSSPATKRSWPNRNYPGRNWSNRPFAVGKKPRLPPPSCRLHQRSGRERLSNIRSIGKAGKWVRLGLHPRSWPCRLLLSATSAGLSIQIPFCIRRPLGHQRLGIAGPPVDNPFCLHNTQGRPGDCFEEGPTVECIEHKISHGSHSRGPRYVLQQGCLSEETASTESIHLA
jgi:hypothetical protein